MSAFANCKINFGLNILDKRADGFHNLKSIFIPVLWFDVIEIIESDNDEIFLYGRKVDGDKKSNSCFKALELIRSVRKFPPVNIHLLKNIPTGAGLGGGSSDGVKTIMLLNEKFDLKLTSDEIAEATNQLGSDCSFFINNVAALVEGRGEIISPVNLSLDGFSIAVVYTGVAINTAGAYSLLDEFRKINKVMVKEINFPTFAVADSVEWKNIFYNDFEEPIFNLHPEIKKWKKYFYEKGAVLSLMSGSGSSVFGIFRKNEFPKWKSDMKIPQSDYHCSNF